MKLKKTIFLSLLAVGLFSGLASLSTSVNANQQNNDEDLKELQADYLNNLKTGSGKFKHTLTGTFDPRMQKTSSQKRKNNYQRIKTQKIKRQYFFFKNRDFDYGNLYSKNLKNKYAVKIKSFEEPMVYADQKMTLYNKKTHKYNTYYHVKSVNSKISGWTWNINLRKYQGINQQNKQILKSFKNVKTSLRMQVIVNQIRTISDSDSQVEYLQANKLVDRMTILGSKDSDMYPLTKKYVNPFQANKISYKLYSNKMLKLYNSLNKYQKPGLYKYNNMMIGVYSETKSSKNYGNFDLIFGK